MAPVQRPTPRSARRILVLALLLGVAAFALLTLRLWDLQILRHGELEEKAIQQQTRELPAASRRGTIYDRRGEPLAVSATALDLVLSPRDLLAHLDRGEGEERPVEEGARAERRARGWDRLAGDLAALTGGDEEAIRKRLENTGSAWEILARRLDEETADRVRAYLREAGLEDCLLLTADSKRYYPQGTLACHAIGFVNGEDRGAYGLEAAFDRELAGEKGRVLTAKNAAGTEMPRPFTDYADGRAGLDLHLTLDGGVQRFAEKALREGVEKYEAIRGGFCIVIEPDTGALLALASCPDYDLNAPMTIADRDLAASLARLEGDPSVDGDALARAKEEARFLQWSSKYLNTAYEPGSTFKPIVMAAALEEGAVTPADRFQCTGVMNVGGWPIRCSRRTGHGSQSLQEALMNSCNPAHIVIGQRLGAERFYEYWTRFGFGEKTGVELTGESGSRFWSREDFVSPGGLTSLAVASFGQRFLVTPMQMAAALSAVVNGGVLMEPYLVASVTDETGAVVRTHAPTPVRRVVSRETSATLRGFLEQVVAAGTGKNAARPGWRIGGKTGSSQTGETDHTIVSFAGFAPADDPAFLVLLAYDWPRPAAPGSTLTAGGVYISGGAMAAPMAGELIANLLDYLGYEREGTEDVPLPDLTGMTPARAEAALADLGLEARTVGEGAWVADQLPAPGTPVPPGSGVVLMLGEAPPDADRAAFLPQPNAERKARP